jgi:hypothetical protein
VLNPSSAAHVSAPYTVGGCTSLGFGPGVTERASRTHGTTGIWIIKMTVPPGGSATKNLKFRLPLALSLNPKLDPCLEGTTCTVGTVSAISPLFDSELFKGTITMAGTLSAPTLELVMPAPADVQIPGSLGPTTIGLASMPNIPFTQLRLRFTGNALGSMFVVQCFPTSFKATANPFSSNPGIRITGALKETGCHNKPQRRPQASVSLSGLTHGAPRLSLRAIAGLRAPKLKKLSIGLPPGLSFASSGAAPNPRTLGRELQLSDGRVARATVRSQWLSVTLKHTVSRTSLSLQRPLLVESRQLATAIRAGKSRTQWLTIGMTDFDGHFTKVTMPVGVGAPKRGA